MPAAARVVFGDQVERAVEYAELLRTEGVVRGLIGPREAPRLWERHLLNCAALVGLLPPAPSARPLTVCDVGSGAGLPGLVLAIARPDLRITLVEPLLRRTRFLEEVVEQIGLSEVEVVRARAENLAGSSDGRTFDVVTSRAVAPLARLAAWSMPLVAADGQMLALKGSSVEAEIQRDAGALKRAGYGAASVEKVTIPGAEPTYVCRLRWAPRPERATGGRGGSTGYPRRRRSR